MGIILYKPVISIASLHGEDDLLTHISNANYYEKKLYDYRRRFENGLPKRFKLDPLLWCFFFSIMLIEDYNRPSDIRCLERFIHRYGIAQSTGIMQQKCDEPLSDLESVQLAAKHIEQIWDTFLVVFAKSAKSSYSPEIFSFTSNWYKYDYDTLSKTVEKSFRHIYGDYCGTHLLDVNNIFIATKDFWESSQYDLIPRSIICSWSSSPVQSNWFGRDVIYWKDNYTVSSVNRTKSRNERKKYIFTGKSNIASELCIQSLVNYLKAIPAILVEVSFIENVHVSILVISDSDFITSCLPEGWNVTQIN